MRIRFTKRAAGQIDKALEYVQERSPQGADAIRSRVLALLAMVQQQPYAGHPTSRPGVMRIAVVPYSYLIDYRVTNEEVVVLRFRHGARRPIA